MTIVTHLKVNPGMANLKSRIKKIILKNFLSPGDIVTLTATLRVNRLLSWMRCGIERIFGWWKRCTGYRRVRYVGHEPNRLELEFKCVCWNLKRLVTLTRA